MIQPKSISWWLAGLLTMAAGVHAATSGPRIPAGSTYVALGSSFAAGPGITSLAEDGPARCGQSTDNYPRQLARALNLKLIDRSCGGATSVDILQRGPLDQPPQLDGLTPDTRLVTVTIGGNDVRDMAGLSAAVCRAHPDAIPEAARTRACAAPSDFVLDQAFARTSDNLKAIAAQVHSRSPQARLVFVDYVTVLPSAAPCAAVMIDTADSNELRSRANRLARLTETIAKETGADLIKASELTRGHDACAPEPWIEGFVQGRGASRGPVSFHPRLAAMNAIARALEEKLRN